MDDQAGIWDDEGTTGSKRRQRPDVLLTATTRRPSPPPTSVERTSVNWSVAGAGQNGLPDGPCDDAWMMLSSFSYPGPRLRDEWILLLGPNLWLSWICTVYTLVRGMLDLVYRDDTSCRCRESGRQRQAGARRYLGHDTTHHWVCRVDEQGCCETRLTWTRNARWMLRRRHKVLTPGIDQLSCSLGQTDNNAPDTGLVRTDRRTPISTVIES